MSSQFLGLDRRTRNAAASAAASEVPPSVRRHSSRSIFRRFARQRRRRQPLLHVPGRFRDADDSRSYTQRHLPPPAMQVLSLSLQEKDSKNNGPSAPTTSSPLLELGYASSSSLVGPRSCSPSSPVWASCHYFCCLAAAASEASAASAFPPWARDGYARRGSRSTTGQRVSWRLINPFRHGNLGRATGRSTAGGGRAGLPQARGEDRRA